MNCMLKEFKDYNISTLVGVKILYITIFKR